MMRKWLCAFMLSALFAGMAAGEHRVGLLSKMNMSQDEFQAYIEASVKAGKWTLFSSGNPAPASFVFYDSLNAMLMGLNTGEVEEIALPEPVGEYFLNVNPGYSIACISVSTPVFLAFGFDKERNTPGNGLTLKDKFNEALMSMKADGGLAVLQSKYIAEPGVDEPEPVKFETYNGADTITVAVTGDLPPIDFVAADGRPAGFNTAVMAEIGRRLHVNIRLLHVESAARAAALASKRCDAVFWFQAYKGEDVQPDVPEGIVLSESYYSWNEYFHIKKN